MAAGRVQPKVHEVRPLAREVKARAQTKLAASQSWQAASFASLAEAKAFEVSLGEKLSQLDTTLARVNRAFKQVEVGRGTPAEKRRVIDEHSERLQGELPDLEQLRLQALVLPNRLARQALDQRIVSVKQLLTWARLLLDALQ